MQKIDTLHPDMKWLGYEAALAKVGFKALLIGRCGCSPAIDR